MIDTDKYEGHTSDWRWVDINEQDNFYLHSEYGDIINHDTPDGKLAQDAPLLLQEVKRLREIIQVQIVTPRSKDFFSRHYGKDDFGERWKEWANGIQDRVWGRLND